MAATYHCGIFILCPILARGKMLSYLQWGMVDFIDRAQQNTPMLKVAPLDSIDGQLQLNLNTISVILTPTLLNLKPA